MSGLFNTKEDPNMFHNINHNAIIQKGPRTSVEKDRAMTLVNVI